MDLVAGPRRECRRSAGAVRVAVQILSPGNRRCRDFDASVPAIGLILDLLAEVETLREFKRQQLAQQHDIEIDMSDH